MVARCAVARCDTSAELLYTSTADALRCRVNRMRRSVRSVDTEAVDFCRAETTQVCIQGGQDITVLSTAVSKTRFGSWMPHLGNLSGCTLRSCAVFKATQTVWAAPGARSKCAAACAQTPEWLSRSHLIMGSEALQKLKMASVTVVGLGGVGSWCAEMLVRSGASTRLVLQAHYCGRGPPVEGVWTILLIKFIHIVAGVGSLVLVDGDVVDISNRNRQLPALTSTLGQRKVDVMKDRLLDINPEVRLIPQHCFLEPFTARELGQQRCSYIIDCIDSIAPKIELLHAATKCGQPIISSMGAGGKIDPSAVMVGRLCFDPLFCTMALDVSSVLLVQSLRK